MVPREGTKEAGCHLAQMLFATKSSITAAKHISHQAGNILGLVGCHAPRRFLGALGITNCRNVKKIPPVST